MPHGKPAGIPCVQLLPDYRCALFGRAERPAVCTSLRPTETMCGASRDDAMSFLQALERVTLPAGSNADPGTRDRNFRAGACHDLFKEPGTTENSEAMKPGASLGSWLRGF